ncbi:MAG: sulfide/dihydroorotate dehydrogenase-like FAD/NAD-binding protein [Chloroflexi bacterium]|nr:sulfide/dihydroorotate dehydrogenase-like FAD/NAD-binding protein [Chloroflexota bacterium]MCL5076114.1 sulfide/dihydroorotate dehydrogenase-like FAD/NAD-binding protein [Chloroflexota bacterium]
MYKILADQDLAPGLRLFRVYAPHIAQRAKPGQFVIVRMDEQGERIPLTIADQDVQEGSVSIIVQGVGKTTRQLGALHAGDSIATFTGPLGRPTEIEHWGVVVCMGGGFGVAPVFQVARAMKKVGNHVVTIMGARNVQLLFWEDRLGSVSDELYITTDDGTKGKKGFVTDVLKDFIDGERKIDLVFAVGPVPMMRAVARTTEPYGIRTVVSLNPIMVDGTGLCGACRVSIGGQTKFACVDGPDFDAHQVDWSLLMNRLSQYLPEERVSLERYEQEYRCQMEKAKSEIRL